MSGNSLTNGLENLNLGELCSLPDQITRQLGTIPKVIKSSSSASVRPKTSEAAQTPSVSSPAKKRRNRNRNRRRRTLEDNKVDEEEDVEEEIKEPAQLLESRVPELPTFPELEILREEHIQAAALNELEEEEEEVTKGAAAVPMAVPGPKKAGSRRRRGGKRKKQKSPESQAKKEANKENDKFVCPKSDDEDSDDNHVSSGRKFIWRNVTKNGWIKKCVLVDGVVENGRAKPGDTVLVKSQGKLKDGTVIDDYPTLVFNVGEHEVIEGLDLAVQSMYKNELSILSIKPEMAYGALGRKGDIPGNSRITYLFGLLHFEKQKEISQLTWAQRRKSGQSRMRLANWWYQRKEYPVAVKCYKKALEYYNNIPTNQECSTPEEYKELLQLMEERLRVMRQVANIFKRIANMIQSGQISS